MRFLIIPMVSIMIFTINNATETNKAVSFLVLMPYRIIMKNIIVNPVEKCLLLKRLKLKFPPNRHNTHFAQYLLNSSLRERFYKTI
jgi:hypothetical protein